MRFRVQIISHFIHIAEYALKYRNYNLVIEILSALDQTTVTRLKETKDKIKSSDLQKLDSCQDLMKDNFKLYRNLVKTDIKPVVPYIGVISKDLVVFEEIPTKSEGLYNMKKFAKVAEQLIDFRHQVSGKYEFSENNNFLNWFVNDRIIVEDQNERFNLSYLCEASKRQPKVVQTQPIPIVNSIPNVNNTTGTNEN